MKAALDILTSAPEFDLVLAVVGSSARFHPELAVKPIIDCAKSAKPIAAYLVPDAPAALAALSEAGVPNFRTPEACADVIAAALGRRPPRASAHTARVGTAGRLLDELEAYALLDRLGIAHAPTVAIDAPQQFPFPYPVAVKALVPGIAHKSDIGGVVLEVADDERLAAAIKQIRANVSEHMPGARVDRLLVQPMISGLGEVLVGFRIDADVGPIIMLAAGGVLAEIYRDRSLRLAPVDLATAHEMIAEVRALAALAGYRRQPAGDLAALAQAVVALSALAKLDDPAVLEAEINPLIVLPAGRGVVAVDALVRLMV
jgi:acyl-CoA synthetase (NDP forming)